MRKQTRNLQTYKSLFGRYCLRTSVEKLSKLTYILHSVHYSSHKIAGSATVYRILSPLSKRLPTPRQITSFVTATCTIVKGVTKNLASYFLKHLTYRAEMVLFHFTYYLTKICSNSQSQDYTNTTDTPFSNNIIRRDLHSAGI
jgi:hypothetical protein